MSAFEAKEKEDIGQIYDAIMLSLPRANRKQANPSIFRGNQSAI